MSLKARVALCAVVGLTAGFVFYSARGLFPEHAFLVGIAISALTYALLRAIDNLRGSAGHVAPGNQDDGGDE